MSLGTDDRNIFILFFYYEYIPTIPIIFSRRVNTQKRHMVARNFYFYKSVPTVQWLYYIIIDERIVRSLSVHILYGVSFQLL